MRHRRGFTIIELFCVVAIIAIMGALVYPVLVDAGDVSSARVMSLTVKHVRDKIVLQAAMRDPRITQDGFPDDIYADWFAGHRIPLHAWTGEPMKVQVVNGPKHATVPNQKSYNSGSSSHTAWYNSSNGSFVAKVPKLGSDAEIRAFFALANNLDESEWEEPGNGKGKGSGGAEDNPTFPI